MGINPQTSTENNWCVYLLLCCNNALYCGISNDVMRRFQAHLSGKGAKYTRMHPPLAMRIVQSGLSKSQAASQEHQIKTYSAAEKRALWQRLSPAYLPTHLAPNSSKTKR